MHYQYILDISQMYLEYHAHILYIVIYFREILQTLSGYIYDYLGIYTSCQLHLMPIILLPFAFVQISFFFHYHPGLFLFPFSYNLQMSFLSTFSYHFFLFQPKYLRSPLYNFLSVIFLLNFPFLLLL